MRGKNFVITVQAAIAVLPLLLPLKGAHAQTRYTEGDLIGKFRNTHYYVAHEEDYGRRVADSALLDTRGKVIARVSNAFRRAADMEGTAKLRDGRVVNFARVVSGRVRYHVVDAPFGLGVGRCPLIPFYTIAVDRKRIPLGSIVEIEETRGMILPDGSVHDGYWRAEDVGGAIKGERIDLFIGRSNNAKYLRAAGIGHLEALTIRMYEPPGDQTCFRRARRLR